MTISVRFVITGPTNVDFSVEEIEDTHVIPWRQSEIQKSQTRVPKVFEPGDEWKILEIHVNHWKKTTRPKINQIVDDQSEMTIYYAYRDFTTTKSISAILDPTEIREIYTMGKEKAKIITVLRFLQSSA